MTLCMFAFNVAAAQTGPSTPLSSDAQECAALTELNLEGMPGGPAFILSAHLVDVPASGLEPPVYVPSGFARSAGQSKSAIHQHGDVTGYVAPQNKFVLKLPLPGDWNQRFFFAACGGFCGAVDGTRCNLGLARGYAAAAGNGGHDSSGNGFDGIWAANAPNLQDDYGWRSSHVVTLIAKAITSGGK